MNWLVNRTDMSQDCLLIIIWVCCNISEELIYDTGIIKRRAEAGEIVIITAVSVGADSLPQISSAVTVNIGHRLGPTLSNQLANFD